MQIITFTDKTTNLSQKREGVAVGNYLAVTEDGFIFKVNTGRKLISTQFEDNQKALEFAQFLKSKYGKFFVLWEIWEEANIFSLARHSVKDGHKILKIIERLENENKVS